MTRGGRNEDVNERWENPRKKKQTGKKKAGMYVGKCRKKESLREKRKDRK